MGQVREIKFRAWVGAMLLPEQANIGFMNDKIIVQPTSQKWINTYGHDWKLESVMQFTGLYDKNGTEVYEGDIVYHSGKRHDGEEYELYYEVKWGICGYTDRGVGWQIEPDEIKHEEVIGNIYENPDLVQ